MNAATTQAVPTNGTLNPPYQPTNMSEKDAHGNQINMCYTTITCMPAYQKASQEELRVQDYLQGRKTGQTGPGAPGATGASQTGGFGGFGNNASTLGQPAQPAGGNLFGQSNTATNTGGGLFGQSNNNNTGGGGLFGGSNATGNTGGGLFGQQNKPATGGGLFGQASTAQPATGGGLFGGGAKPAGTGFGFGNTGATNTGSAGFGGFGANNNTTNTANTNTGAGLFGGGSNFGQQNNQQQQPSTGFGFGQQPQPQQNNAFGANNNTGGGLFGQNKPAGTGLFGGNTGTNNAAGSGSTGFGGFGMNNNTQAPKPAFGFGGGANTAGQTGQTGGGLFGTNSGTQPGQTGGLFGANNNSTAGGLGTNQPQTGATGGGLFGGAASANTGGGLFGNNNNSQAQPAAQTGGLFGQQKPPAPPGGGLFGQTNTAAPGGGLFGNNNASANTGGGLFGQNNANQPKPAFGTNTGTGLFGGNTSTTQNTTGGATGGGLFGQSNQQQPGLGGGLFGQKPAGTSGFGQSGGLGASSLGGGQVNAGTGSGLFGQSAAGTSQSVGGFGQAQQAPAPTPPSLTSNPYGTDALFGSSISAADLNNKQPLIPFNVAPKSAKKPPLVPSVFSSPRNQTSITRLRGTTPGASMTRAREGTPLGDGSTSFSRMGSAGPSLFRGLSDEQALSPQAFVPKPSAKRLVLDDSVDVSSTSFSRALGQRNPRAATALPEDRPSNRTLGLSTSANRLFSPALETSARRRAPPALGDDTFNTNASLDDTPLRRRFDAGNRASSAIPRLASMAAPMPPPPTTVEASVHDPEGELPFGYYMRPTLPELRTWAHADLASVENFTVGRTGYGEVTFDKPVDLTAVPDLNEIAGGLVVIRRKELLVYPEEEELMLSGDGVLPGFLPGPTQSPGVGLNQPATVSLDGCWARDKSTKAPIKDPSHPRYKQHIARIKSREGMVFVSFDADKGTWRFKVEHFSRYALDSDSELDDAEDVAAPQKAPGQSFSKPVAAGARSQAHARATADESEDDVMEDDGGVSAEEDDSPPPVAPLSFAEAMHVEPRRMQVMQASFFGDMNDQHQAPTMADRQTSAAPAERPKLLFQQSVFRNGPPATSPVPAAPRQTATPAPAVGSVRSHSVRENSARESSLPPALVPSTARPNFGAKSSLTAQPRIKFMKTSMDQSVLSGAEGTWTDPVVALTGSFRLGFGFPNLFVRMSAQKNVDVATASQVKVVDMNPPEDELAIKMLSAQLEHTTIEFVEENGVPRAAPQSLLRFHDFASLFEAGDRRQEACIWRLGSALFDDIDLGLPDTAPQTLRQEASDLRRKAALSQWLKMTVSPTAEADARGYQAQERVEATIFSHLTCHDMEKATLAAMSAHEFHLATLLAQLPGDQGMREDLQEQLLTWRDEGVYSLLSEDMRKLYELLAGNVTFADGAGGAASGDKAGDMLLADSLDWKRAFGLHLWYGILLEEPLQKAVRTYDAATASAFAPLPLPPYLAEDTSYPSAQARSLAESGKHAKDTLYQLLKVYSEPEYLLEDAILPTGHSKSSTSYRLTWQLYQLLARVLGVRDFCDRDEEVESTAVMNDELMLVTKCNSARADKLTLDLASQLESGRHLQWAVFVLLYLELPESRAQAIKELLTRSIHILTQEHEDFIVSTLKVPRSWLALARANTARSEDDLWRVYEHSLEGKDLAQAHAVAVRDLAPEVVVRGDRELLKELFAPFLHEMSKGREETVPGWSWGGKLYLDWVDTNDQVGPLLQSFRRKRPATAYSDIQSMSSRISELATLIPTVLLPDEEDKSTPGALTRYAAKINSMSSPLLSVWYAN